MAYFIGYVLGFVFFWWYCVIYLSSDYSCPLGFCIRG